MFSPALAHVLARLLTREGWDGLYLNPRLRDGWRSWIVAWLGCVLLILAGAAVFFAAFPETFDPSLNTFREQLPEAARRAGEPLPLDPGVLFAIQAASAVLVAPIGPGTARLHRRGGPPAWAAAGRSSRVSRLLGGGAVDSPAVGRQRGARLRLGVHRSGARQLRRSDRRLPWENLLPPPSPPPLAKSIADASWSYFVDLLELKAESAGVRVVRVQPRFTSQRCSNCAEVIQESLSVRTHICKDTHL